MVVAGFVVALGCFKNEGFSWRKGIALLGGLSLFILFAEAGQLLLPRRSFDWMDVFWGIAGSALGLLTGGLVIRSARFLASNFGNLAAPTSSMNSNTANPESSLRESDPSANALAAGPEPFWFMGVKFWNADAPTLLKEMDQNGGMLAVPSAPSLAQMSEDPLLKTAYQNADWSVVDGGYVALVLRGLGRSCQRISGHQLIERLLDPSKEAAIPFRDRRILWVTPSSAEEDRISRYLVESGFDPALQKFYLAPFYQSDADFDDAALKQLCGSFQADWVIVCLGGGRQEKLAWFLRNHAKSRISEDSSGQSEDVRAGSFRRNGPAILCTGAAIAFFTGGQAKIPRWADRLYLGWLFRIASSPKTFFPRYLKAFWHFPLALLRERGTWFAVPDVTK